MPPFLDSLTLVLIAVVMVFNTVAGFVVGWVLCNRQRNRADKN